MTFRLIGSTAVAMIAVAALANAAVNDGDRSVGVGTTDPNAPAISPGESKAVVTPMTAREREATRAAAQARLPIADPTPHFSALGRPASSGDALPVGAELGTAVGAPIPGGARKLRDDPLGVVRAVPTDRELCVSTTYGRGRSGGATDTCVPSAVAIEQGAWTVTQCSSDARPQRRFIAGAVPDGVALVRASRGGNTVAEAPVQDNAFALEVDAPIDTVEVVAASGVNRTSLPPVAC